MSPRSAGRCGCTLLLSGQRWLVNGARILITGICAATGMCFAVLAGLSFRAAAFPVRRFHIASLVVMAVTACFAYLAYRAVIVSRTDEDTLVAALRRAIIGAFVGLFVMLAFLFMFGADTQALLAHALGQPASSFTAFRLLIASVLLGFGVAFVVGLPRTRA